VTELLVILVLTLANAVFAGAEIAILSLRKTRLNQLLDEQRSGAKAVVHLRRKPERFLATVQVGITVISASAAAFGGASMAEDLTAVLAGWGVPPPWDDRLGFAGIIAFVSYLSLVLGELVPKSLALRFSERYALLVAPTLRALGWLATPLVWFLTASSNVFLRLFGDRTSFTEARLSPEELQQMVEEASRSGQLDPQVGDIVSRAFDFTDLRVGAVMLPRARIVAARRTAQVDELVSMIVEHGHARMPVYEETLDKIVGYVVAKDVVLWSQEPSLLVLDDILRPAYFVPESTRAGDVLKEMQRRRTQIAVVLDEFGSTAGLVTIEDLVEELVGDIAAEHESPPTAISLGPDGSVALSASTAIREVNRALDLDLPEGDGFSTLAGLCMHLAGRIPATGIRLRSQDGTEIEVLEASPRRVERVRIRPRRRPPATGETPLDGDGAA
jgi:putative hemolysin